LVGGREGDREGEGGRAGTIRVRGGLGIKAVTGTIKCEALAGGGGMRGACGGEGGRRSGQGRGGEGGRECGRDG